MTLVQKVPGNGIHRDAAVLLKQPRGGGRNISKRVRIPQHRLHQGTARKHEIRAEVHKPVPIRLPLKRNAVEVINRRTEHPVIHLPRLPLEQSQLLIPPALQPPPQLIRPERELSVAKAVDGFPKHAQMLG